MIMLTCIQVLFNATTTTKYAILDLIVLNADTYVSTGSYQHTTHTHVKEHITVGMWYVKMSLHILVLV